MPMTNTELLIRLAQSGKKTAIDQLWSCYGDAILSAAVSQASFRQSDFSYRGLSSAERRRAIMGEIFLLFRSQVLKFDPTRNDDFLGYMVQHVIWHTLSEKRRNSQRSHFEAGGVDDIKESAYAADFDKEISHRAILKKITNRLEGKPALQKCLKEYHEACMATNKGEIVAVAEATGCTRATIYNQLKAIRKAVQDDSSNHLAEEIRLALAA